MKTRKLMMGAVAASGIAVAAWAHGGATGIVKERMDAMGAMKDALKVLTPMMQGKTPYDAEVVRSEAAKISSHAGEALTSLFPEGTGGAPSEVKDAVWQEWDDFALLAERLRAVSEGMAEAADNGLMMAGGEATGSGMMGGSSMMSAGTMMGGNSQTMDFSQMSADGAFAMLGQVCSACHTRFRVEK